MKPLNDLYNSGPIKSYSMTHHKAPTKQSSATRPFPGVQLN